ncbi:MAG: HAMP domain-containing protein [Acidobacteria bacterium]|nr:HAMP domain-containing protein [Acidobacteriota bacterium]
MSLFLKIFLWFWLAMALIVSALMLVTWSTSSEPLAKQWQTFVGESINLNSATAVQIYENEGIDGLQEYFDRQKNKRRINSIGFFKKDRQLIAGDLDYVNMDDLFDRATATNEPEFLELPDKIFGAKKIVLENGETYFYVIELKRFSPPPFFTAKLMLQGLVVLFMTGLVCYALARYLAAPISKLREATQKFASGELEARVGNKAGKRGDELACLANDFDEMAERIQTLITSEKRLTQDISHELRSPLARMNVALEIARAKSNPETATLIERLEKESGRLNDLIGQLLTLSKLETGSQSFDMHEINLSKLVEQIVSDADFEAQAAGRSVEITQIDKSVVFGNEQLICSAVENVLRNAVRYTKPDSAVQVSVENVNGSSIVKIRDFGEGVPESDLGKMFRPFYRVQEARDRKSGGIGLGLAIAERAVNSHNGKISAKNVDDQGLLVEISLPTVKS